MREQFNCKVTGKKFDSYNLFGGEGRMNNNILL